MIATLAEVLYPVPDHEAKSSAWERRSLGG